MTEQEKRILEKIQEIADAKGYAVIAIDGRCGSGKSWFGSWLAEQTDGTLFHMDDFFLRPQQRTAQRYQMPGENVDHERFLEEVLLPIQKRETVQYRSYNCSTKQLSQAAKILPARVNIVEGSYSLHPSLQQYYDLKIFLTVSPKAQLHRIQKRNPDRWEDFRDKWIPMEEKYFAAFPVEKGAEELMDTTCLF